MDGSSRHTIHRRKLRGTPGRIVVRIEVPLWLGEKKHEVVAGTSRPSILPISRYMLLLRFLDNAPDTEAITIVKIR
jgi:hypothetical protein